jgi:hypothetical protein
MRFQPLDCGRRLELATTGVHWLTGLPLVGAQILVVLLARSSSDKTRLNLLA